MRFAVSAVAAVSGLFLLGLAFYGQPALYLHQAQEKWDELVDTRADDQPPGLDSEATVEQVARLQQQVAKLEAELAARRMAVSHPAVEQSQPIVPLPAMLEAKIDQPQPVQPKIAQPAVPASATSRPSPPETLQMASSEPAGDQSAGAQPAAPQVTAPPPAASHAVVLHLEKPGPQTVAPVASPAPTAPPVPERRETASAAPPSAKTEVSRIEQPKRALVPFGPPKPEVTEIELSRAAVAKQTPPKMALLKSIPAPPPLPQTPPTRQNDDTLSVLARLRQLQPGSAAVQQSDVVPPVEPRPRPVPSPSLPGLTAARAALASGRIEDARRLLQQAQLQLVFRPVNVAGDDPPWAAKGAADVAGALNALSANDVPLSRRYVDIAVFDLSGSGTGPALQEPPVRTTGYAPAYPPH